jgi:hypothetical protein
MWFSSYEMPSSISAWENPSCLLTLSSKASSRIISLISATGNELSFTL